MFVLDKGNAVFVWIGKGASPNEKKNGFGIAQVRKSKFLLLYIYQQYILSTKINYFQRV